MAAEAARAGQKSPEYTQRERPLRCSGVGTGSQTAEWDVLHRICLADGRVDCYKAPGLPNSKTPGLLGQISMANRRTLMDTFTKQMYLIGPGGYEIRLSPGSQMLDLESSQMGHLMLPCSRFGKYSKATNESQSFVVGNYFEPDQS